MAKGDYTAADRTISSLEAGDKVQETVASTPDADAAEFARDNGVSSAAFANYATALEAHASRTDIEGLAERRLREYGSEFADADFMRMVPGQPGPGSVNGQAPVDGDTPGDEYGVLDAEEEVTDPENP